MWKKKYPGLSALMMPKNSTGETVAPIGLSQPEMANRSMKQDLKPMGVPHAMPQPTMLKANPEMDEHLKRKVLMNLAQGRKSI